MSAAASTATGYQSDCAAGVAARCAQQFGGRSIDHARPNYLATHLLGHRTSPTAPPAWPRGALNSSEADRSTTLDRITWRRISAVHRLCRQRSQGRRSRRSPPQQRRQRRCRRYRRCRRFPPFTAFAASEARVAVRAEAHHSSGVSAVAAGTGEQARPARPAGWRRCRRPMRLARRRGAHRRRHPVRWRWVSKLGRHVQLAGDVVGARCGWPAAEGLTGGDILSAAR